MKTSPRIPSRAITAAALQHQCCSASTLFAITSGSYGIGFAIANLGLWPPA